MTNETKINHDIIAQNAREYLDHKSIYDNDKIDTLHRAYLELKAENERLKEWKPISEAPKDGTNILVVWLSEFHCPIVAHWNNGKWSDHKIGWKQTFNDLEKHTEPTHWKPLPTPPKQD